MRPVTDRVDAHLPTAVTAVVVTHARPHLAGRTVRALRDLEGLSPGRIVVVVNGEGGLDDPLLTESVRVVSLRANGGPATGFRVGLETAFQDPAVQWAYLCEDDIPLVGLPMPRLGRLLAALTDRPDTGPVGAVVAYGRLLTSRGHARNLVPSLAAPALVPVDVAAWGATLVSREAAARGVLPDPSWFFGYEDFDFFCRLRAAGLAVLLDSESARAVAWTQTSAGRAEALAGMRPGDADEPWRAYYTARNFIRLARIHGSPGWLGWHLLYSARRWQVAAGGIERRAIRHGLSDGLRGRTGPHPAYLPTAGPAGVSAVRDDGHEPDGYRSPTSEPTGSSEDR